MGPLLAGILVNAGVAVGKELVGGIANKVFSNDTQTKIKDFTQYLKAQGPEKMPSTLATYLGKEQVTDLAELNNLRKQLGIELVNSPDIQQALSEFSGKEPLTLTLDEGGGFNLKTKDGRSIEIKKGTGAHDLATKIHQMFSMHEMSKYAQVGSVYELANKVVENPQLNATWSLRNENGAVV